MATDKVGVYRKWHGPVPTDAAGVPLPRSQWPGKRAFSWAARWFGNEGKRYSRSFKTRKDAGLFAEGQQRDVRQGEADPPRACTLREFHELHRELSKGKLRRGTLLCHLGALREFAKGLGWDHDMRRTRGLDVEAFQARRLEQGRSAMTVNKEFRALKRVYNLAIRRGYRARGTNPCAEIEQTKVTTPKAPYLSPQKFAAVFEAWDDLPSRVLLVLLYTTGIRLREAMHLTWGDLDLEHRLLHIQPKKRAGYLQAWEPKDYECRVIPLCRWALGLLQQWQARSPRGCPYVLMDARRWSFYRSKVDAGTWSPTADLLNNTLKKFQARCRRTKVGHYTLHDLRRSCLTNWGSSNQPIHVVAELAGHADLETTKRYYLSVQKHDLDNAREAQQQLLKVLPTSPDGQGPPPTDPKLTHRGQNGQNLRRELFPDGTQLPLGAGVA